MGLSRRRNHIATRKPQAVTLGREEAIANSWPDGQEPDTKAYQADKLADDNYLIYIYETGAYSFDITFNPADSKVSVDMNKVR